MATLTYNRNFFADDVLERVADHFALTGKARAAFIDNGGAYWERSISFAAAKALGWAHLAPHEEKDVLAAIELLQTGMAFRACKNCHKPMEGTVQCDHCDYEHCGEDSVKHEFVLEADEPLINTHDEY